MSPAEPAGLADDLDPVTPALEAQAGQMARFLRLVANEKRLLVAWNLRHRGEMSVGELVAAVDLSQSALSQHLALLREDGLVATRRDAQMIYYRLADPRVPRVLELLRELFPAPAVAA